MKKIIFTIISITLFVLVSYSADQEYSNSKLMQEFDCSINGIINKKNLLHQDDESPNSRRYYNKWLEIWRDSLKTSGLNYIGPINIEISDSLSSKLFDIKRNDYIVNFVNSKIIFVDQIDGFYVRVSDDLGSEYHIKTKTNKNCTGFNIISDTIYIANLFSDKINIDTLSQWSEFLETKLTDYFIINRDRLFEQLDQSKKMINFNQNENELKNQIRNLFSYQYLKSDLNNDNKIDYIIIGTNNDYKYHSFVAILIEGDDEIKIKTHSNFQQVIKIFDSYFLLLHHYKPSTGWSIYSLYQVSGNELIEYWSDSSLSR